MITIEKIVTTAVKTTDGRILNEDDGVLVGIDGKPVFCRYQNFNGRGITFKTFKGETFTVLPKTIQYIYCANCLYMHGEEEVEI